MLEAAVAPTGDGFRADCVAYTIEARDLFRLGGHPTRNADDAVAWLARRAGHIADQLDPAAAHPLRAWTADAGEHAGAIDRLGSGQTYSFLVRDGPVRYLLTASPTLTPAKIQAPSQRAGDASPQRAANRGDDS